jgi:hypothetical protein
LEGQQLDVEVQSRIRGNHIACAVGTIGELRREDEPGLLSDAHLGHSLVPAPDDLAGPQLEGEGLSAVSGAVELFAVGEGAGVVHGDVASLGRLLSVSRLHCLHLHFKICL